VYKKNKGNFTDKDTLIKKQKSTDEAIKWTVQWNFIVVS